MQLPFDQILGKNNPLKLPDVAAVEAAKLENRGRWMDGVTHETPDFGRDGMEKPKEKREVIHKSSGNVF